MKRTLKKIHWLGIAAAVAAVTAATAIAAFAASEAKMSSISVSVADTVLNNSDKVSGYLTNGDSTKYTEYYDVYGYDGVTLTVKYSDGSKKTLTGEEIPRFEAQSGLLLDISDDQSEKPWGLGTHAVTYTLGSLSTKVNYTVAESKITSVTAKPLSNIKPLYHLSGEYRTSGGSDGKTARYFCYALEDYDYDITLRYSDGHSVSCPADELYALTGLTAEFSHDEKELSAGKQTGYCTVDGVTGKFSFEIAKSDIKALSLSFDGGTPTLNCPTDGSYQTDGDDNEYFRYYYDRTAIRAKVTYTSGQVKTMTLGELSYTLHGELELDDGQQTDHWLPGTHYITGKINGVEAKLPVTVSAANVTGVRSPIFFGTAIVYWDPVPAEGYVVERNDGSGWKTLFDVKYGKFQQQVTGLAAGQEYLFGVRAYNTVNGKRVYTARMTSYTGAVPKKMTGLKLLEKTSTSLKVGWNKNSGVDGYLINAVAPDGERKGFPPIYHDYKVSYNMVGLKPNTTYKIEIRGFIKGPNKIYGEPQILSFTTDPGSLDVSGFKLASRGVNSVKLSWTKNATAEGYQLGVYKGGKWTTYTIASGDSTSFTVTGLSSATKYNVRIRSYATINGKLTYGTYKTGSVCTAPPNMTGFKLASRGVNSVKLSWTKNSNATGYQLEVYKGGKWVTYTIPSNKTTSYTVTGLSAGTKYNVRICAYKTISGKNIYGAYKTGSVYTAPATVSGFKLASRTASSVKLSWSKSTNAAGYQLGIYKGGKWLTYTIKSGKTVSYTISGLSAGTKYNVRIRAYMNIGGKTVYGNYKTGSVYTSPASVSGVRLSSATKNSLSIKWNRSTAASGYQLEIKKNGKWVSYTVKSGSTTSYKLTALTAGTKYSVRIRSYKNIGTKNIYSGYTNVMFFTGR